MPNLTTYTQIQNKGLLTIPAAIRAKYNLRYKDLVQIYVQDRKIIIEPIRTLPYPVRSYKDEEINQFLQDDKKGL